MAPDVEIIRINTGIVIYRSPFIKKHVKNTC